MSNLSWARCTLALCCLGAHFYSFAAPVAETARAYAVLLDMPKVDAPATLGVLSGTVADPSGAKIPHATVRVRGGSLDREITSDDTGRFSVPLPPGTYAVTITAAGFVSYTTNVTLTNPAGHANIDAKLVIATQAEEITVPSDSETSTAGADNKSALIFKGSDLKTFSDDESTFQQEIEALAGKGIGGKSPELLIDGFSNGRFPPKNTIREIRINQNPFSAAYDRLGFGRIEIFTKPGTDKLHGNFSSSGTDNVFNAKNPYATIEPPYYTVSLDGNLSGPINKKTSLFVSGNFFDVQNNAIVDAIDPTLLTPLSEAVPAPQITQTYALRLDRQVTAMNTFTGRYEFNRSTINNSGVGLLVLPSQGVNSATTTQTLQLTDTQVIGTKIISEAHFQYLRTRLEQKPVSTGAAVVVQGVFNGGGSTGQTVSDNQDRYEVQELLTIDHKSNYMRFGARYRFLRDSNFNTANYNGQFTFPDLATYKLALAGETPAQIFANGGGNIQYNLTSGIPSASVLTDDVGIFAEDEWKVSKVLTLDLGFRFESQSAVPNHLNPSPHLGFAWAVGKTAKKKGLFVLRGGGAIFYDRFASTDLLTAIRQQTGTRQASYYVENPNFYQQFLTTPAPVASLGAIPPTLYRVDPHLRIQYDIMGGLTIERAIGKIGNVSANYIYIRSDHQYLSRNINAPLPGTYDPADPTSGVRPLGGTQNIYQFSSDGAAKDHIIFANANLHPTKRINLFSFAFVSPSQKNDAPSSTSFPTNQYNPSVDFGREAQAKAQVFLGVQVNLPLGIDAGIFGSVQAGTSFNIITGTDLNGDTIYNDRPAFATSPTASSIIYKTKYGTFDANPQPGEKIIPVNYATAPAYYFLELDLGRTFKFGPRPATPAPPADAPAPKTPAPKPDPAYSLSFNVEVDNPLNHVNPGTPIGVLSSPLFGKSISLNSPFSLGGVGTSANRTIQFRCNFTF
jgi:hypothetical protein